MLIDVKSVTITEKGQIAIPRDVRIRKGFEKGSKVAVLAYDDRIELRPLGDVGNKMDTAFASEKVLAKDWNSKKEDKAWKNL